MNGIKYTNFVTYISLALFLSCSFLLSFATKIDEYYTNICERGAMGKVDVIIKCHFSRESCLGSCIRGSEARWTSQLHSCWDGNPRRRHSDGNQFQLVH